MEILKGGKGLIGRFTNTHDRKQYLVSTVRIKFLGIKVKDPNGREIFGEDMVFDVFGQAAIYCLSPKRKMLFLVNLTATPHYSLDDFHQGLCELLEHAPIDEMYGNGGDAYYAKLGYLTFYTHMFQLRYLSRKPMVFLVPNPGIPAREEQS